MSESDARSEVPDSWHIQWIANESGAGWRVPRPVERTFVFSQQDLDSVQSDLSHATALKSFKALADARLFHDWWLQACNPDMPPRRFVLHFAVGRWDIPWELLLDETKDVRRQSVSIVRALAERQPPLRSAFDGPLSVLIVQGDDGSSAGAQLLDLAGEAAGVVAGWEKLAGVRANVNRPVVIAPNLTELEGHLAELRPHLLWFSGHGRKSDGALLFNGGTWVSPKRLAACLTKSRHVPAYAVFWACDSAVRDGISPSRASNLPPLFEALYDVGVSSILAMQAPIHDDNASTMACEVFLNLAAGKPLDFAAASARALLLEAEAGDGAGSGDRELDWACPVVWGGGVAEDHLRWNAPPNRELAQLQLAGERITRGALTAAAPLGPLMAPAEADLERARRWLDWRRTWVQAAPAAEHNLRWVLTLQALQAVADIFVLAVELEADGSGLERWAEEVLARLGCRDAARADFLRALDLTRTRRIEGWRHLCALPGGVVAIRNPPPMDDDNTWFWKPLIEGNTNSVVVLGHGELPAGAIVGGWKVDSMAHDNSGAALGEVYDSAPQLAGLLATLDMPMSSALMKQGGLRIEDAPAIDVLLLKTPRGRILPAAAVAEFRRRMTSSEVQTAHRQCMILLALPISNLTSAMRERRLGHCLSAGERTAAAQEALPLLEHYWTTDQPRAAVKVFERFGASNWRALDSKALMYVAWGYVMLGKNVVARTWLNRTNPISPFDRAWACALRAEIEKATGGKQAALDEIEEALRILTEAADATVDASEQEIILRVRRRYQQDHARIVQYLFMKLAEAAYEYEALLKEWGNDPAAAVDVAVVMRNYAECLRSLSGGDPADPHWNEGTVLLEAAWDRVGAQRDLPVVAEIAYERARVAFAEGDRAAGVRWLDECQAVARRSGHLMLHAIAAARRFWELQALPIGDTFDRDLWRDLETGLSSFPDHGWAVRSLVTGRLRAARRLEATGAVDAAREMLLENEKDLADHPSFDEGTDRLRIAATYAGLERTRPSPNAPSSWQAFLRLPWAGQWLAQAGHADADAVWKEVR
jgi:hypothetical protein